MHMYREKSDILQASITMWTLQDTPGEAATEVLYFCIN